jgi:ATP-dependent protease ClpP protease subunit
MNKFVLAICMIFLFSYTNGEDTKPTNIELIKLTEDNFITIRGDIDGQSASNTITDIMSKKSKDLYVYISTNGGSVDAGMQIVQLLKALESSGVRIHCIADVAMSMGFVIFQYCENRYVMPSSILMQHQLSLSSKGSLNNVNSYMDFINSMEQDVDLYQAKKIGITLDEFKAKVAHDWWLFGSNAVKNGVADKLVHVMCDFKHEPVETMVQTFFGDVKLIFSNCPIARDPIKVEFGDDISSEDRELFLGQLRSKTMY